MSRRFILVALFVAAACERSGPSPADTRANAANALRNTVSYPQSTVVSVSTGSEAAEMVLSSPAAVDTIAAWYRLVLPMNKWTIKTSSKDRGGNVTIYAERDKRPLWITLQPSARGTGTTYRLVGVFNIDSTKTDSMRR